MRQKLTLIAALALASGLLASCGGDDGNDDTSEGTGTNGSTGTLTKAEYIKQADAICAAGNKELEQAAQEAFPDNGTPSADEIESFAADSVEPELRSELEQLQELPIPEGDEGTLNDLYDSLESALDQLADDPGLLTDQQASAEAFAEANRLAKQYGLKECGEG